VRWEDLEQRLAEIYLKRAEKVAFVPRDADVDFEYVAKRESISRIMPDRARGAFDNGPDTAGESKVNRQLLVPARLFLIQIGRA